MNLLSKRQLWKVVLLLMAMIIVGSSLWWSGNLVSEIQEEERKNVELWAEAVQKRAKLVNYTEKLFNELREEERQKAELWARASRALANAGPEDDLNFLLDLVAENKTVPVIQVNERGEIVNWINLAPELDTDSARKEELERMKAAYEPVKVPITETKTHELYYTNSALYFELKKTLDDIIKSFISETVINSASVPVLYTDEERRTVMASGNIDSTEYNTPEKLRALLLRMESSNQPILVELGPKRNLIFYQDSFVQTQLRLYPIVQFIMIFIFILVGYVLFNQARKSEQNQVWAGMAKETAHQLGTPLSSLMAWIEFLKGKDVDPMVIQELTKDTNRLATITDRFSKIGSTPKLEQVDMREVLENAIAYIRARSSDKVSFHINIETDESIVKCNVPLFEWVIENLSKNAIDAMSGAGELTYTMTCNARQVIIDITDTGKGISPGKYKQVFSPGFTTKKRGWGLGLSLAKRIIELYHKGKIFVKWSEVGKGTTFRIILKR